MDFSATAGPLKTILIWFCVSESARVSSSR